MKIYDCITFSNERILYNLRLNILDKFVDKFIVIEANYTHSGNPKKINFNVNHYPKFKKKIIHVVLTKKSDELKFPNKDFQRWNSHKRMEFQRNKITDALTEAKPEDIIMYSDSDEIPNLDNINFNKLKEKIIIFKQKMFYYKFNLILKNFSWYGTRAFRKKNLTTIQWMRHVKPKKYGWWRIDVLWKKDKYINMKIIENGGWHFTQLKSSKDLYYKFLNDEHHDEFKLNKITYSKVKDMIKNKYTIYSHFVDKRDWKSRWNNRIKLTKVLKKEMPIFLLKNIEKYKKWVA